jgi:hypothetical protein
MVAMMAPARKAAMLRVLNFNNTSECPSQLSETESILRVFGGSVTGHL